MRYYDYSSPRRSRINNRRRRRTYIKIVIFVVLLVALFPFFRSVGENMFGNDDKKEILAMRITPTVQQNEDQTRASALGLLIRSILKDAPGKYSVVITHMKTGERYTFNEYQQYQSGSLYKLWVMGEALHQIEKKTLDADKVLSKDIVDINKSYNIASESAELNEGTITVTVNQAIQQMITISHNYAALLLAQEIKLSNISDYLQKHQFMQSRIQAPPITSAYDIASLFELLYKGQLATPEDTKRMIDLLKKQKLNNKLPKYLPSDVVIAHKTGELDQFSHDGGIVYTPKGDYVIVILTQHTYPPDAEEKIAEISQAVYRYFMK